MGDVPDSDVPNRFTKFDAFLCLFFFLPPFVQLIIKLIGVLQFEKNLKKNRTREFDRISIHLVVPKIIPGVRPG